MMAKLTNIKGENKMTARNFCKKYSNTVKGGYTKTKIINRARKWGLNDTICNIVEYVGGYLKYEQCKEFEIKIN